VSAAPELPAAFLERLERILPEPWLGRALASFAEPRPVSLRANRLRVRPEELCAELEGQGFELEPVAWCEDAFELRSGGLRELGETAASRRGALLVQGLSSLLAPLALAVEPGDRVLDLCAAPGGKASQIACALKGRGALVANDRSRARFFRMRALLEAQGASGVELCCRPGERLARERAGSFDRVLVDAPCSGEGRFRLGRPESFADWKPSKVRRLAGEQRRLLRAGLEALRPGGVLVYATCTFAPEENEGVVARVLERLGPEVELVELPAVVRGLPNALPGLPEWGGRQFPAELARTRRIAPDGRLEGFFLARLRRLRAPQGPLPRPGGLRKVRKKRVPPANKAR
jgi:16S rRNA C967 or C1407 C5-methylase (RsmB/RsmF family)